MAADTNSPKTNLRERLMAFIRDEHPEWWPREVVVFSHHVSPKARGETLGHRQHGRVSNEPPISVLEPPEDNLLTDHT